MKTAQLIHQHQFHQYLDNKGNEIHYSNVNEKILHILQGNPSELKIVDTIVT